MNLVVFVYCIVMVDVDPFCFSLSKSPKFLLAYYMNFFPSIGSNSSLIFLELLRTSCIEVYRISPTFSIISHISALRKLGPQSSSYSSQPLPQSALGIGFCTSEAMSVPLGIALLKVCSKAHSAECLSLLL